MRRRPSAWPTGIAPVAVCLAAAALLLAGAHHRATTRSAARAAAPPAARADGPRATFAVLHEAPALSVPDTVRRFAREPWVVQGYAPEPGQTRAVRPPGGGAPWYVLEGRGGICLLIAGGGACGTRAEAAAGRVLLVRVRPDGARAMPADGRAARMVVAGLVPDGVRRVTGTRGDGTTVRARRRGNLYVMRGSDIRALTLTRRDGPPLHVAHVPPYG